MTTRRGRRTCDLCGRRVWFWQLAVWRGPTRSHARWLEHVRCYDEEFRRRIR